MAVKTLGTRFVSVSFDIGTAQVVGVPIGLIGSGRLRAIYVCPGATLTGALAQITVNRVRSGTTVNVFSAVGLSQIPNGSVLGVNITLTPDQNTEIADGDGMTIATDGGPSNVAPNPMTTFVFEFAQAEGGA